MRISDGPLYLASSQTLYFLFKVRRARVIKNKNAGGFIDHQRKEVRVGEDENRRSLFFFLACSPMFSKRTKNVKKNKTTSVYRLLFNSHKKFLFFGTNNAQQTTSKGRPWSRGTNWRLQFAINGILNLNNTEPLFKVRQFYLTADCLSP